MELIIIILLIIIIIIIIGIIFIPVLYYVIDSKTLLTSALNLREVSKLPT
jgi:hypothetical protein